MTPPQRCVRARRPAANDPAHVANAYMTLSLSLHIAYQHTARAPPPEAPRRRPHHQRTAAALRAPLSTKTIAPSNSRLHQLPELPKAATCDVTHKRLSAEAQLIQDQARQSRNIRLSNLSDRETLRCLESFPLHITSRSALVDAPTARKSYTPPILPKYFPSSPRKSVAARFDRNAPQTTQPTNSSGRPLGSVKEDGNSFSDESELSEDDVFFGDHGKEVGDLLPVGGISLFAHLEDIKVREAGGSRGHSSRCSSLPRVIAEGSMDDKRNPPTNEQSRKEEIDEWLHVGRSVVLEQEIAEDKRQRVIDAATSGRKDTAHEVDAESMVDEDGPGASCMSESGSVEWHADPAALAHAICESELKGGDEIDDEASEDDEDDVMNNTVADLVVLDMAGREMEAQDDSPCSPKEDGHGNIVVDEGSTRDEELEDEDDDGWLEVEIPENELNNVEL